MMARRDTGAAVPDIALPATDGSLVSLAGLKGRTVVYAYPMTGRPGAALRAGTRYPARENTAIVCLPATTMRKLLAAGVARVFGLSTQDSDYQRESGGAAAPAVPPFMDAALRLTTELRLPVMLVDGARLLKRMALIIEDGLIAHVFYPVFPPDRNAADAAGLVESAGDDVRH